MTYKQNLHTHTVYCDGKDKPEDMILKAIELGFDAIGFSGHSPTKYSLIELPENLEEYKSEIYALKEKYRGKIDVYCGLEIDMFTHVSQEGYEYLIGSMHYLKMGDKYVGFDRSAQAVQQIIDEHFGGNGLLFAKEYYEQLKLLPQYGKFDIVGHFDIITKNIEQASLFDTKSKEYRSYALDALRYVNEKIGLFEVNTGAISRGYRTSPYPERFILEELNKIGGKIIITSDCHDKNHLDCHYAETLEYVKSCGFKEVQVIKNGKFVGVKF